MIQEQMGTITKKEKRNKGEYELYLYGTLAAIMYTAASSLYWIWFFATQIILMASSLYPGNKTLAWKA